MVRDDKPRFNDATARCVCGMVPHRIPRGADVPRMTIPHTTILAPREGPVLTSRQQFQVLDRLLARALHPLVAETPAFYEFVGEVLALNARSRRSNADEMVAACTRVLTGAPDPVNILLGAGLDRDHAFEFLRHVRNFGDVLRRAEIHLMHAATSKIAVRSIYNSRLVLGQRPRLTPALTSSAYWQDCALAWRNHIVAHYSRMLMKGATGMSRASGGRIEVDPTFHDAWIAACTAASRFRSDQATFAGFLGRSLKGTYRIAASNALGLAAPGARVRSEEALQTTVLDDASELSVDTSPDNSLETDVLLRAVQLASHHPDVRLLLMTGEADPTAALRAVGTPIG